MRAIVIELDPTRGFGLVQLPDGTSATVDASACSPGIPPVGSEVEVEIGVGYKGRKKITRLTFAPRRLRDEVAGLLIQRPVPPDTHEGMVIVDTAVANILAFAWARWRGGDAPSFATPCRVEIEWEDKGPAAVSPYEVRAVTPAELAMEVRTKLAARIPARLEERFDRAPRDRAVHELQATDEPQWAQAEDWPVCCGARATFLGSPPNRETFAAFAGTASYREGDRVSAVGVLAHVLLRQAIDEDTDVEDWSEVLCFACSRCRSRYYTYQIT